MIYLSIYSGNGNGRHGGGGGYQKRNPNEELFCRDNFLSLNALQMIEQVLTMCVCVCACMCVDANVLSFRFISISDDVTPNIPSHFNKLDAISVFRSIKRYWLLALRG